MLWSSSSIVPVANSLFALVGGRISASLRFNAEMMDAMAAGYFLSTVHYFCCCRLPTADGDGGPSHPYLIFAQRTYQILGVSFVPLSVVCFSPVEFDFSGALGWFRERRFGPFFLFGPILVRTYFHVFGSIFIVQIDFRLFGSISMCSDRFPFVRIDFDLFGPIFICSDRFPSVRTDFLSNHHYLR